MGVKSLRAAAVADVVDMDNADEVATIAAAAVAIAAKSLRALSRAQYAAAYAPNVDTVAGDVPPVSYAGDVPLYRPQDYTPAMLSAYGLACCRNAFGVFRALYHYTPGEGQGDAYRAIADRVLALYRADDTPAA